MPGLGQKGEDALLHRARLIVSDQVVKEFHRELHQLDEEIRNKRDIDASGDV